MIQRNKLTAFWLRYWRAMPIALSIVTFAGVASLTVVNANAQEWRLTEIDRGTKPALALTPDGDPVVVYMLESQMGWVRIADRVSGDWRIKEVASGYFYGPPDIAVGSDGTVHAAYHDHQAPQFKPDKGDAVYLRREDGKWTSETASDPGHDGWDNRVTVDGSGQPHMVAVDPLEFGGSGVEYYARDDEGAWTVEQVGTGPQTYKYAVSVAVGDDDVPWISYHDGSAKNLKLAHRAPSGWQIETVDTVSGTGFFSEMAMDADGGQHISYYAMHDETSGTVRHAFREGPGEAWRISDVGRLDNVSLGFTGARNITSIDLDDDGEPWIAYSDEKSVNLARFDGNAWHSETVVQAENAPLGQIISLAIDQKGRPHIAYAIATNKSPLDGFVWYATRN